MHIAGIAPPPPFITQPGPSNIRGRHCSYSGNTCGYNGKQAEARRRGALVATCGYKLDTCYLNGKRAIHEGEAFKEDRLPPMRTCSFKQRAKSRRLLMRFTERDNTCEGGGGGRQKAP